MGEVALAEFLSIKEGEGNGVCDEAADNPELDVVRRRGLRMDYGLESDLLEIRVREAMKPYLLAEMFLEDESEGDAPRHFIVAE